MFRKDRDISERSRGLLKSKDIKDLQKEILKKFASLENDLEFADFLNKKVAVTQVKLLNRTLIYFIEDTPYFFDKEGRSNIYPTIYFLWRFPKAVRNVVIHSPVSKFVLNGADLMLPGIVQSSLSNLVGMRLGETVCLVVNGNPSPFAVGDSCVDFDTTTKTTGSGQLRGRGVEILHVFSDYLYRMSKRASAMPNVGFNPGCIVISRLEHVIEEYDEVEDAGIEDQPHEDGGGECDGVGNKCNLTADRPKTLGVGDHVISTELNKLTIHDDASSGANDGDDDDAAVIEEKSSILPHHQSSSSFAVSTTSYDDMILRTFLLALKYIIKDKSLPMLANLAWNTTLKCVLENEDAIQIKRSRHKKVSSLLKYLEGEGLLTLTTSSGGSNISIDNSADDVLSIISVNRAHSLFYGVKVPDPEAFKKRVLTPDNLDPAAFLEADRSASDVATKSIHLSNLHFGLGGWGSVQSVKASGRITVVDLYKAHKGQLIALFENEVGEKIHGEFGSDIFRGPEVKSILIDYMKRHGLEDGGNKACVCIPPTDCLYKIASSSSAGIATHEKAVSLERTNLGAVATSHALVENDVSCQDHDRVANNSNNDVDDGGIDRYDDDEPEDDIMKLYSSSSSSSSTLVAGVLVSPISPAASTLAPSPPTAFSIKPLGVGGWGVEKGATMKPVYLSSSSSKGSHKSDSGASTKKSVSFGSDDTDRGNKKTSKILSGAIPAAVIISKEALLKLLLSKMTSYCAIVSPTGEAVIKSGKAPTVSIIMETRMGNKVVTRVMGLDAFPLDTAVVVKDFQKKFACSVSLATVQAGGKEGKEIVIQGNLGSEVEDYLTAVCRIPRQLVSSSVGKGVKPKKR